MIKCLRIILILFIFLFELAVSAANSWEVYPRNISWSVEYIKSSENEFEENLKSDSRNLEKAVLKLNDNNSEIYASKNDFSHFDGNCPVSLYSFDNIIDTVSFGNVIYSVFVVSNLKNIINIRAP